ncbi:MAG: ELM1/GtrOC1 family putative glycosyltransferase [Myxococcota bacterium]
MTETKSSPGSELQAILDTMECVVLPPRPGAVVSERPPIEIYLGTEPAQYRANRVFGYSIEQARDPGREVRIHLMSELPGFDRRGWTTGFTNYRFAIPALCGGQGRAIYNDEDQIYLTDPGVLFDHALGDAAHLSISDTESSVMLIDCEKMAPHWTLDQAQNGWKRSLLKKAGKSTGLRGDLDPGWNARDEEFEPGRSHLLHYTTLHTQPWRPFPERFVYQRGSYTQLWHDLERKAIAEGFEFFTQVAPSLGFRRRLETLRGLPLSEMGSGIGVSEEVASAVDMLARRTKSRTLVELVPDVRGDDEQAPGRFGLDSERRLGLLEWLGKLSAGAGQASAAGEKFDAVLCVDGLDELPAWDIPWIVESMFAQARRFVAVAVRCPEAAPRRRFLLPPQGTVHTPDWWRSHFEAAAARHPEVSWELIMTRGRSFEAERILVRQGGPRPDQTPPRVWTLSDGAPGNDRQVTALADELGWPSESVRPPLSALSALPFMSRGAHLRTLQPGTRALGSLQPPWPDLLIVAGRATAPVARWIREQAGGRTQVVALGSKAATPASEVDLAVTARSATLFPHPNRVEVDRPLVPANAEAGASAGRWHTRLSGIGGPRIALLLGSGTQRLGLDGSAAESLGRLVADSAEGLGGAVIVSASRNTDRSVFEGCLRGVGNAAFVYHETKDQRATERAWPAVLEAADVFVVAGLGETTLAEVCTTGRPVFLSPHLRVIPSLAERIRDGLLEAIVARAEARPENDRGTTRPQEGLELICARLIAQGWVRPRKDAEALRGRLVRAGHARLLRAPIRAGDLEGFSGPLESEIKRVADAVREKLGVPSRQESRADETHDL